MVRSQELKSAVFSDCLVRGGGGGEGCPPIFMLRRMATQPLLPPLLPPSFPPPLILLHHLCSRSFNPLTPKSDRDRILLTISVQNQGDR